MEGYIKLYRKSLDSAIFKNPNLWQVWCYCLMRANHKTNKILFDGMEMMLKPGQFITSRFEGGKDCKMNSSTFRDQLYKLKRLKSIDTNSDNKKSLITVVNWDIYQIPKTASTSSSTYDSTPARHRQEWKKYNNEDKLTFEPVQNG